MENASNEQFLETTFTANQHELSFRLKNKNEKQYTVWRYNNYHSCVPYGIKRQVLFSTLQKVNRMASDAQQLRISAASILHEFQQLSYPKGILKFMCAILARDSNNRVWLDIRDSMNYE